MRARGAASSQGARGPVACCAGALLAESVRHAAPPYPTDIPMERYLRKRRAHALLPPPISQGVLVRADAVRLGASLRASGPPTPRRSAPGHAGRAAVTAPTQAEP